MPAQSETVTVRREDIAPAWVSEALFEEVDELRTKLGQVQAERDTAIFVLQFILGAAR